MKKLIAILAIAMLISGTCYAGSDTAPDLSANLVASAVLEIEVLDAFFLVVSPDDLEISVDTDTGQVQSQWLSVLAGCGDGQQDWYLKFKCSNFVKTTDATKIFGPELLSMQFAPGLDPSGEDEIGAVIGDYDDGDLLPVADTYVNIYQPLTTPDHRQGSHGCAAAFYGTMPSQSTGIYQATITFEMVAGLPA